MTFRNASLARVLADQARQTLDAIAVQWHDLSLSYRELDERTNGVASWLANTGIRRGEVVALCVERSLDMVVGVLGILKAGGAYVPVDPGYPAAHIAYILADANARLLVTQQRLLAALPSTGDAKVLCLDRDQLAREAGTEAGTCREHGDDLAYVIYTSGSTGRAKGTMVSHGSVWNLLSWLQDTFPLTAQDTVIQSIAFSFDASVCDFRWPFLCGARLLMLSPDDHRDPGYLSRQIEAHRGTVIFTVPTMLTALLARPDAHRRLRSLRLVFSGGEPMSRRLQERFAAVMPAQAQLINVYGPTEATMLVTWWRCVADGSTDAVPIGGPIANAELHVLDDRMRPVAAGETGELFLGGSPLARGYLARPALTAERFLPDPFRGDGARLYRTGDLARHRADGALEFVGRADWQVKLRGFRIELNEVELALTQQVGVRDGVVVVRDDQLVGYVVPEVDAAITPDGLLGSLGRVLPAYMVPSRIMVLDALPLTLHGKVDRDALPAPARDVTYVGPTTALEQVLTAIVANVLGLDAVGTRDNFFRLGLTSLQAAVVAQECTDGLGIQVTVGQIFAYRTVADLIGCLATNDTRRVKLEQTAELLLRVSSMTDEELARLETELSR